MFEFSKEVQNAKENDLPIVALESTIITHGMPFPQNFEMAKATEDIVRQNGAVPATIAIIDGKIKIGLEPDDLMFLATTKTVQKCSRRDIPFIIAQKLNGGLTVAATMLISERAGIKVFATGGIGGVHRNYTVDISADLDELAITNVAVVCAGAKSILDLPRTMEDLETKSVPVIGFKTDELPAFYTNKSGISLDYRIDDVKTLAAIINTKWEMNLQGGVVVANPIPEQFALDSVVINQAIDEALNQAEGITGKQVTPFLLDKVKQITGDKSLEANIQLVYNNAKLAAQLACEL